MYIYIAIAVLLAIAIEFSFLRIIDQNLGLFIALTAIASSYLLSWLRWENGADWDAYIKAFNDLNNWDAFIQNSWWEPLYKLISLLVNYFANNYTLFLFIFATILLAAKLYFFCREISWLQFVFVNYCLSISDIFFVRQSVAAWIVAAAIDLFFRKKYIPSLLTALVSFSVHKSSIMCYLVAVLISLFFIESNKRRLLITAIITVSATILFHIIITHVTIEGNRYAIAYFSGDFVDAKASILDGKTRGILKSLLYSFICIIMVSNTAKSRNWQFQPKYIIQPSFYTKELAYTIAMTVFVAILPLFSQVFLRYALYIFPFYAYIISLQFKILGSSLLYVTAIRLMLNSLLIINLWFVLSSEARLYIPLQIVF